MRLRPHKLPGYWFRRQVPLGPYVLDFACLEVRLLIEVDGSQHADQVEQDNRRTAWLESQGFGVLRLWNHQVLKETDDVVETIWIALESIRQHGVEARLPFDPPLPDPPPPGGREISLRLALPQASLAPTTATIPGLTRRDGAAETARDAALSGLDDDDYTAVEVLRQPAVRP